jgi:hypothetical protein
LPSLAFPLLVPSTLAHRVATNHSSDLGIGKSL